MLSGDTILVEFHLNDHVEKLGRKLMSGDVLEAVHLADQLPLNETSAPAQNIMSCKMLSKAAGYGTTWYQHTWRVKCTQLLIARDIKTFCKQSAGQADTEQIWQNSLGATSADGTGAGVQNNPILRSPRTVYDSSCYRFTINSINKCCCKSCCE